MKPLDLTKPVQTRVGGAVEIISTTIRGIQKVAGYVRDSSVIEFWHEDGRYYETGRKETDMDLINVPEKRTVEFWVNAYSDGKIGSICDSKKEADDVSIQNKPHRIACLHIVKEFPVGEGL